MPSLSESGEALRKGALPKISTRSWGLGDLEGCLGHLPGELGLRGLMSFRLEPKPLETREKPAVVGTQKALFLEDRVG